MAGQAELLEVGANRLGRDAALTEGGDGRAGGALGELLPVVADDEAVVDHLGRLEAERACSDACSASLADGPSRGSRG